MNLDTFAKVFLQKEYLEEQRTAAQIDAIVQSFWPEKHDLRRNAAEPSKESGKGGKGAAIPIYEESEQYGVSIEIPINWSEIPDVPKHRISYCAPADEEVASQVSPAALSILGIGGKYEAMDQSMLREFARNISDHVKQFEMTSIEDVVMDGLPGIMTSCVAKNGNGLVNDVDIYYFRTSDRLITAIFATVGQFAEGKYRPIMDHIIESIRFPRREEEKE